MAGESSERKTSKVYGYQEQQECYIILRVSGVKLGEIINLKSEARTKKNI